MKPFTTSLFTVQGSYPPLSSVALAIMNALLTSLQQRVFTDLQVPEGLFLMYGKLPPPVLHVCSYFFFISGICSLGLNQFSGLLQLPLHVSFLSTGSLPLSYHSSLSPESVLFTNLVLSLPYLRYSISPLCLVTEIWTSKDYVLGWPSCYSSAFLSFQTHIHTRTHRVHVKHTKALSSLSSPHAVPSESWPFIRLNLSFKPQIRLHVFWDAFFEPIPWPLSMVRNHCFPSYLSPSVSQICHITQPVCIFPVKLLEVGSYAVVNLQYP